MTLQDYHQLYERSCPTLGHGDPSRNSLQPGSWQTALMDPVARVGQVTVPVVSVHPEKAGWEELRLLGYGVGIGPAART
jgi:hypothetical protein